MATDTIKHMAAGSGNQTDILLSIGPSRQSETVHSIVAPFTSRLSNPDDSTQTWAELGLISGWDWSDIEHSIVASGSLH